MAVWLQRCSHRTTPSPTSSVTCESAAPPPTAHGSARARSTLSTSASAATSRCASLSCSWSFPRRRSAHGLLALLLVRNKSRLRHPVYRVPGEPSQQSERRRARPGVWGASAAGTLHRGGVRRQAAANGPRQALRAVLVSPRAVRTLLPSCRRARARHALGGESAWAYTKHTVHLSCNLQRGPAVQHDTCSARMQRRVRLAVGRRDNVVERLRRDCPRLRRDCPRLRRDCPRLHRDCPRLRRDYSRLRRDFLRLRRDCSRLRRDCSRGPAWCACARVAASLSGECDCVCVCVCVCVCE
jgi:hypothetical protein